MTLSSSFVQMRGQLLALQKQKIETERIAAVARARTEQAFEIPTQDICSDTPESIRATLFDPFVSFGKPNGRGLTMVSKIIQNHFGAVSIEQTSEAGTTDLVRLSGSKQAVSPLVESTLL